MKADIVFLGTGQAIPTAKRNHTAVLMKYKDENILIDCGEGTQRQFRKLKLNPCKLTRILITHWHGDHILGLPGLLQTLALSNYSKTLYIYGPKGTKKFIKEIFKMFIFAGKLKFKAQEVRGKFLETPDFYIQAIPLEHGAGVNGYCFIEKNKRKLNKTKLKKLKLPQSKILKKLQEGKSIKYKGKIIKAKDVSTIKKGKKITFLWDTKLIKNCYKLAKNSDLLIAEANFAEKESSLAKRYKHLTAKQAAQIAKQAKARQLILTHLSQRYEKEEASILKEAKKIFPKTKLAKDLMKTEV